MPNRKRSRSESVKLLWKDPEYRARQMKTRNKTMYNNPEWIEKQRTSNIKAWADPELRELRSMQMYEHWDTPEIRKKLITSMNAPECSRKAFHFPERTNGRSKV